MVGEQGGTVHEHGADVREAVPQPVQDREPVSIEIAPVDQVKTRQPVQRLQGPHRIAAAEDHDRGRGEREGEVGDLVLYHENATDSWRRGGELGRAHGQLGVVVQGVHVGSDTETYVSRLTAEPVAALEVGGAGVDPVRIELEVEELGEHALVLADELRVDAGHVHLAQVHARGMALVDPADCGQQVRPVVRQFQRPDWTALKPRAQARSLGLRLLGQLGEPAYLAVRAEQFPGLVVAVQPGAGRDRVDADQPATNLLVLHP